MERSDEAGKGRIVLATVKGDVHDIGKNLVDIILSNNGYDVVNIGIKQPISAILEAADSSGADVIGMSGLLVKSTVVMQENLAELNSAASAGRWPVLLGGAALTRAYVEQDLAGPVRRRGPLRPRRVRGTAADGRVHGGQARRGGRAAARAAGAAGAGRAAAAGHRARGHAGPLRRRRGQPGARARRSWATGSSRASSSPTTPRSSTSARRSWASGASSRPAAQGGRSYEELVETEGRPRLRMWLERVQTEGLLEAGVVYGYFPAVSEGDDLVILDDSGQRAGPVHVPAPAARPAPVPGRLLPLPRVRRDRRGRVPAGHGRAAGSARRPRSCSRRTPTATTSSCTACRCSWPRRWPSTGTAGSGTSSASATTTRPTSTASCGSSYRGCRYSFGYPACPDLEDRAKVMRLLEPERIGVTLSEEFQLAPEQSTDALIVHHPEANYFST